MCTSTPDMPMYFFRFWVTWCSGVNGWNPHEKCWIAFRKYFKSLRREPGLHTGAEAHSLWIGPVCLCGLSHQVLCADSLYNCMKMHYLHSPLLFKIWRACGYTLFILGCSPSPHLNACQTGTSGCVCAVLHSHMLTWAACMQHFVAQDTHTHTHTDSGSEGLCEMRSYWWGFLPLGIFTFLYIFFKTSA